MKSCEEKTINKIGGTWRFINRSITDRCKWNSDSKQDCLCLFGVGKLEKFMERIIKIMENLKY